VIADAARVWAQILSGRREPVLSEAPAEPVLPRGEVERRRMDELDDRPRAHCC